eukprot:scaffold108829_cov34-Prasinocladus_malaysianus.AAC.1
MASRQINKSTATRYYEKNIVPSILMGMASPSASRLDDKSPMQLRRLQGKAFSASTDYIHPTVESSNDLKTKRAHLRQ